MSTADEFRSRAADLKARAAKERDLLIRAEYGNLALAYERLAEQAERTAAADEGDDKSKPTQPSVQQQQQKQPDKKD